MKTNLGSPPKLVRNSNKSPATSGVKSDKRTTHNALIRGTTPKGGKAASKK